MRIILTFDSPAHDNIAAAQYGAIGPNRHDKFHNNEGAMFIRRKQVSEITVIISMFHYKIITTKKMLNRFGFVSAPWIIFLFSHSFFTFFIQLFIDPEVIGLPVLLLPFALASIFGLICCAAFIGAVARKKTDPAGDAPQPNAAPVSWTYVPIVFAILGLASLLAFFILTR